MSAAGEGKSRGLLALSSLKRRRKSRDYVDYDYLRKLSPAEREWLGQFTDEYYNGNGRRYDEALLDVAEMDRRNYAARSDVMNAFERVELGERGAARGAEDVLVDALDGRCPAEGMVAAPPLGHRLDEAVPALASPGLTAPGAPLRRPARESVTPRPRSAPLPCMGSGALSTRLPDDGCAKKSPYLSKDWSQPMSKASHQKKRTAQKRLKAVQVAPPVVPTAGGDMFRQVVGLLKCGLHTGVNAKAVAQAIDLMEQAAAAADALPQPAGEQAKEAGDGQSA